MVRTPKLACRDPTPQPHNIGVSLFLSLSRFRFLSFVLFMKKTRDLVMMDIDMPGEESCESAGKQMTHTERAHGSLHSFYRLH